MVSSSSRNSSTSPTVTSYARRNSNYDVFVSFRGEDTRYNFTDFLFDAFQTKGIFAFRDDNNLPKGESIRPELLYAIQHSQIYVVVFSRNYASSIWCLQELVKICECVQMYGKHVLPVFYDVDPSDVRHQKGIYAEAFAKHEQRFQHDSQMVPRWRKALTQVANLAGWDLRHKPQSTICKKIVQKTISILDCISSSISKDLVGMDSHIQELEKLLLLKSVDDVRVVGICGKGGIGKTTLATVLYDQISQQFGACCFIDDVSKIYRLHGPLGLQKEILDQTLGQKHHQICNQYNAANLIRRRLCRQKALMILDNVDHIEQLEKITVHREWFSAGSRIIIISRDEHILSQYGVDAVYQVPLLSWTNSRKLLCRKAFKPDHISNSYKGLVNGILNYVNGLPLAIKVLGSFLFGRDISEWKSTLASLRENPDKGIMNVLRLSFDGLRETEKEIFLHIACFFDTDMKKYVKNVLNCCGFHVDIGLKVLIEKSLVSIEDEKIVMHDLLEELGRKIVAENTIKEPTKWRRLWFDKQLLDVTLENMEKNVEAIVLDHYHEDYSHVDEDINAPQIITVILKVHMHCEACSQEIKKRIERIKGVVSAEPDRNKSLVTVKGVFESDKLVEYVYKRTRKQAVIVKQEPEKKEEAKEIKEEKKKTEEKDKNEKGSGEGEIKEENKKTEEKDKNEIGSGEGEEKKEVATGVEKIDGGRDGGDGEEKKVASGVEKPDGGGGGDGEEKKEVAPGVKKSDGGDGGGGGAEETTAVETKKNEYYYNPPRYGMEFYAYPARGSQIFSDENPNACSVM
ncbi:disease resistance protein RUN1-like [Vicia villosa]|uniref:disease resistance protein RUN1-like n=1 Tax=Vicia villosa TaxID=3911 RepID=UPI00273BCC46|nr:disease resistance protein RUN1-like [Vicia villosa]